jgi:hypothetical protein
MTISPVEVHFDDSQMWVALSDGRTIGVPLAWFPRLAAATPQQLAGWTLSPLGIHWEDLDEDIAVEGLLAGRGDRTRPSGRAA